MYLVLLIINQTKSSIFNVSEYPEKLFEIRHYSFLICVHSTFDVALSPIAPISRLPIPTACILPETSLEH
jgi:hypothetical protein